MLVKRLKDQRGFTTVTVMGVLLVGGLLVAATFTAVNPDISQSRADQDNKQAYAAAESGLQWYMNGLGRDNTYYLKCDNPPAPNATEVAPVNQKYVSGDLQVAQRARPAVQVRHRAAAGPGFTACSTTDQYSMIDSEGNMHLRITGRSRGETRTILATLRRQNFLDYIYFTHFETLDPYTYNDVDDGDRELRGLPRPAHELLRARDPVRERRRGEGPDAHQRQHPRLRHHRVRAQLARQDRDQRPHALRSAGSCSANPDFKGTLVHPAGQLEMPPSNADLETLAAATYKFVGKTEIVLNGGTMNVKNTTR